MLKIKSMNDKTIINTAKVQRNKYDRILIYESHINGRNTKGISDNSYHWAQ